MKKIVFKKMFLNQIKKLISKSFLKTRILHSKIEKILSSIQPEIQKILSAIQPEIQKRMSFSSFQITFIS